MRRSRSGGVKTYFAPSQPLSATSSSESSRYCGQVSANAGRPAVARFADLVQRVFAGEMHDVDGHAGHLRHGDGAMHGLSLGLRGPRECVIDGRRFALGQRLLHDARR